MTFSIYKKNSYGGIDIYQKQLWGESPLYIGIDYNY